MTIASGLKSRSSETVDSFRNRLRESILNNFTSYTPCRLAILGEDPDQPVTVQFNDALTESYMPETRPCLKVIAWANFAR